jgi:hypothetical protein
MIGEKIRVRITHNEKVRATQQTIPANDKRMPFIPKKIVDPSIDRSRSNLMILDAVPMC